MQRFLVAAATVAALSTSGFAAEVESGIPEGGRIGVYTTVKCGGAEDGVKVGRSLCYT